MKPFPWEKDELSRMCKTKIHLAAKDVAGRLDVIGQPDTPRARDSAFMELVLGRLVAMTDRSQTGPVWDAERALAYVDGYVEDLRDVLEIWLHQGPKLLSDIREALEGDDAQRLHLAAHTMKGSLQILGARSTASAEALEALGQAGQTTGGSEWLARLENEFQILNPQISMFLETGRAS
jgi:HPt (histidine-containing phosphotransfer) domain-containing protein